MPHVGGEHGGKTSPPQTPYEKFREELEKLIEAGDVIGVLNFLLGKAREKGIFIILKYENVDKVFAIDICINETVVWFDNGYALRFKDSYDRKELRAYIDHAIPYLQREV